MTADRVIVEVPERAIAQEPETLCEALLEVREMGVHVALDGGGIVPVDLAVSSCRCRLRRSKSAVRRAFVLAQRLGLRGKGAIAARLRFAHQYNLEAVAVGAEDEATMAGLAEVGFTAAQGIWIQKPMPLDDLLTWNGTWARGRVSMDPMPVATSPRSVRSEAPPRPTVHVPRCCCRAGLPTAVAEERQQGRDAEGDGGCACSSVPRPSCSPSRRQKAAPLAGDGLRCVRP